MPLLVRNLTFLTWSLDHGEVQQTSSHCQITARKQGNMTATLKTNIKQTRESIPSTWNHYRRVMVNWRHKRELYSNYSMSPRWIWSDKTTNGRIAQVGYNHFIPNKGSKLNSQTGFCRRFLLPQFYKVSRKSIQLLVTCVPTPAITWLHIKKLNESDSYANDNLSSTCGQNQARSI